MIIELRGKRWKQVTKEAYIDLKETHRATFHDWNYGEITYFKEVDAKCVKAVGGQE